MTYSFVPQPLIALLDQEEALGPVRQMDDLQARLQRRASIAQQIYQLEEEVRQAQRKMHSLPQLPPLASIHWARAVRALPNLVFLEVDTTGLYEDAGILRLVVLDAHEHLLLDCLIKPSLPISQTIMTITGLTNTEVQASGIPVSEALDQLRQVLHGRYALSYNLDFDRGKLKEAAQRAQLNEITIIGEDLMAQAMTYLHSSSYPKLEWLCQYIGKPLPRQPHQTALDRAKGQIAVLNAIAELIGPSSTVSASSSQHNENDNAESEADEHPFD